MYQGHYETEAGMYKDAAAVAGHVAAPPSGHPDANPNLLRPEGPQVSCLISEDPAEHELRLLAQMGVTRCFTWIERVEHETAEHLAKIKGRCAEFGVELYNVGCLRHAKNSRIILGAPDRDAAIAEFCTFVRAVGAAGIGVTTFTWEPDGVWSVASAETRGGAAGRAMDAAALESLPASHGRVFEDEELWGTMKYFLERVLPVAEASGVRLALHPNDPPMDALVCGVRPLMRTRGAFERAFALADATGHGRSLGMEFCCGCWLEGGKAFGDVYGDLEAFCRAGRVLIVHLRNVTSPLPRFVETFIDGGYGDVCRILRSMIAGSYGGTVILDHTPPFVEEAGPAAASAFAVGYMKAGIRAAQSEAERRAAEAASSAGTSSSGAAALAAPAE